MLRSPPHGMCFDSQFCVTSEFSYVGIWQKYCTAVCNILYMCSCSCSCQKYSLFSQFVFTCRVITEDASTFACLLKDLDSPSPLGTIDAVYTSKFSLMDYLEDK